MVAAAGSLQRRHPLATQDAHLAGLRASLELEREVALERRHGELGARAACTIVRSTSARMSSPSRSKRGSRATWTSTYASPGRPPPVPAVARAECGSAGRRGSRPGSRPPAPSPRPCGRFPLHAAARRLDRPCPTPRHVGQAWVRTNSPKTLRETCCRLRPGPPQVWHGDALRARARRRSRRRPRRRPRLSTSTVRSTPVNASASSIATAIADVAAASPPAAVAREEVVAEEGGEDVAQVREGEVARGIAAAPQSGMSVLVVQLSPLGVGERLVRLGDGAEALLRVGVPVHIRMQLACKLAERLLDLGVARRAVDAEELVVVASAVAIDQASR